MHIVIFNTPGRYRYHIFVGTIIVMFIDIAQTLLWRFIFRIRHGGWGGTNYNKEY